MSFGKTAVVLFDAPTQSWHTMEIATPAPGEGELLVRVLGCTVCGSDLHTIAGRRDTPNPIILGHEIVGEIAAQGPGGHSCSIDGTPLAIGDRVVWSVVASCDECFFCKHGLPQKCSSGRKYGHIQFNSPRDIAGGFAQHVLLLKGTKCQKLPAGIPLELACPVGCATATAVAAVDACRIEEGFQALVLGGGLVGLMTCAFLRYMGVQNVCCVEPNSTKRSLASRFGATQTYSQLDRGCPDQFHTERGFDAVIECCGQNGAFEDSLATVRTGGEIVLVGAVFPGPPVPLVVERIVRRNLRLTGIHNYSPEQLLRAVQFSAALALKLPAESIVDRWFALSEVAEACEYARNRQPLRVGIRPVPAS